MQMARPSWCWEKTWLLVMLLQHAYCSILLSLPMADDWRVMDRDGGNRPESRVNVRRPPADEIGRYPSGFL
jgi:hypothetical protein